MVVPDRNAHTHHNGQGAFSRATVLFVDIARPTKGIFDLQIALSALCLRPLISVDVLSVALVQTFLKVLQILLLAGQKVGVCRRSIDGRSAGADCIRSKHDHGSAHQERGENPSSRSFHSPLPHRIPERLEHSSDKNTRQITVRISPDPTTTRIAPVRRHLHSNT